MTDLEAIRKEIPRLERVVRQFEAYEKPLLLGEVHAATSAVIAFKEALEQVKPPLVKEARREYALACADDARFSIAAYAPHRKSQALRYLQRRQKAAKHLAELVRAAHRVVAPSQDDDTPRPRRRPRPTQMRLIWQREAGKGESQEDGERRERRAMRDKQQQNTTTGTEHLSEEMSVELTVVKGGRAWMVSIHPLSSEPVLQNNL